MHADDLSPDVRAFVADKIHSVAQLELLLLLVRDPTKSWSAVEASRSLYISLEMTEALLAGMNAQGLLLHGDSESTYKYGSPSEEIARPVRHLAELYKDRRVTVVTLIYAAPVDKIRRFADAFRFTQERKKEDS